jgi:hypothetical protein
MQSRLKTKYARLAGSLSVPPPYGGAMTKHKDRSNCDERGGPCYEVIRVQATRNEADLDYH